MGFYAPAQIVRDAHQMGSWYSPLTSTQTAGTARSSRGITSIRRWGSGCDVIHVVAQRFNKLSSVLPSVAERGDVAGVYRLARADGVEMAAGRTRTTPANGRPEAGRDIYIPDLWLGSGIIPGKPTEGSNIKPRDFR